MNSARANAYAKLNLTLDVVGREGGFHMLDSLVVSLSLSDRAVVRRRKDGKVRVCSHGGEEEPIERAAERFFERFEGTGADITVYKNVPVGAGLGGSSTDVAATLLALARLEGIADMGAVKSLADELGSDTGYLLFGGGMRLNGRGERLSRVEVPTMYMLLLLPEVRVDTVRCFEKFDDMGASFLPKTERCIAALPFGIEGAARFFGNHLTAAACEIEPKIYEALSELKQLSPLSASMTGSGSGCFGVYPTRELAEWAKSRYKGKCRALVVKTSNGAALFSEGGEEE